MVTDKCKVTSAYVKALAVYLMIGPLETCDPTPFEARSLWLCDLEGNILLPFAGTGGGVASMTCRVLGTIVRVLEAAGLMNLTLGVLGAVFSSE